MSGRGKGACDEERLAGIARPGEEGIVVAQGTHGIEEIGPTADVNWSRRKLGLGEGDDESDTLCCFGNVTDRM